MIHNRKEKLLLSVFLLTAVFLWGCSTKDTLPETSAEAVAETLPPETEHHTIVIEVEKTEPDYEAMVQGILYAMDNVNVRRQPNTDSEIAGKLSTGDAIRVLEGDAEGWTKVLYEGELCYVATRYFSEDEDWQEHLESENGYKNGDAVPLDMSWRFAEFSQIHSGTATMYLAVRDRKNIVIGVNAGHGTKGGSSVKTWCHPDKTPKVTGGTTVSGETKAVAVSGGMSFNDGTPESKVTLREAQILKEMLLEAGYDVLMIRDGEDVQLDNVARTVICNNTADCHIAIHWDGDGLDYDKGCFYMSVPEGVKYLDNVAVTWEKSEALGDCLIKGLEEKGNKIFSEGYMDMDLTQTSYSSVPSVDIELGNQVSDHSDEKLRQLASGLLTGIRLYFEQ